MWPASPNNRCRLGGMKCRVPLLPLLERGLKVRPMVLPDSFIDHDKPEKMYERAGLNAAGIVATVLAALGRTVSANEIA